MTVSPRIRQLVLTAHVTCSVGWLGAIAAFVVLAVTGLTSEDVDRVRGAYLLMEPIGWFVLVPLAVASLLTGLLQSLVTSWGLLRHYWVLFKLLINVVATAVLVMYMPTLASLAELAAEGAVAGDDVGVNRSASPLIHACLGLGLLLVATVLALYKPRGVTPWARRGNETT